MNQFKHLARCSFIMSLLCLSLSTYGSLQLNNITSDDMDKLTKDFSANFMHTTVSGASSLGSIFGFELGLVGGMTKSPELGDLVQSVDPNVDADQIYHAALIGQVSVPMGFTVEASYLPKVGPDDFKLNTLGLGVKWTASDLLVDFPLSLALRGHLTKSSVRFTQTVSSVTSDLQYDDMQTGVAIVASKNLAIVEPYATLGYVKAKGELSGAAVFSGFPAGTTSASGEQSSTYYGVGVEVKLLVLRLGAEYTHLYDTNRLTGKLSFFF